MLASYRLIETSDVNEIEAAWIENSRGRNVDMSEARPDSEFVASLARFDDGALTHCRYDAPIAVSFEAADYTRLIYQMRQGSAVLLEGETSEIASSRAGCLIPAGRRWRGRHAAGLEDLAVRIPVKTLQRKLSAYLGSDRQALDLLQPSAADPRGAEELRSTIFEVAAGMENVGDQFLPNLAVTSLDEISLGLFTCFSREMIAAEQKPAAPSTVQLGRVEQYLVAYYTEPLTLETLAEISGVSARSVIWYFRVRYGCTPRQYLERVRLQMAHLQLRIFSGNSVECVALQCGFPSVAAFRCSYVQQFGVPPIPRYCIN
ncbi:helix-turn-helix domain-containing protein [Bradyrhizobium sp.]|uniref:helix-turn-helix domain-containing protein n=1 Tax=Bradyrhizobium sp. TaxID=376 RepID=UPI0025C14D90|nr:AraC family transcriptional regulator [Bradyrhizobium sp.]MBV8921700.1 helix-turn-helix transcriptional regulator [Bradyrhizobium sp.]